MNSEVESAIESESVRVKVGINQFLLPYLSDKCIADPDSIGTILFPGH